MHNNKIETGNFVATLSTSKGTHYTLTISAPAKFKKFFYYWNNNATSANMNEFMDSFNKAERLHDIYYKRLNGLMLYIWVM